MARKTSSITKTIVKLGKFGHAISKTKSKSMRAIRNARTRHLVDKARRSTQQTWKKLSKAVKQ